MPYCKHTYTYSHFTLSHFFCNLSIHTDTNKYSHHTYRYMPYCAHTYSYAHFTLSQFSASRPPRPRRPSRGPGKNSLASQKELVRSAGPSAGPGQAVLRRKTVNATINPVKIERMVPRAGLSAAQPRSRAGLPRSRAAPGCRAATQPTRDRHCLSPSIHWGPPPAFRSHGGGRRPAQAC